jgi:hypothetical protein
MGVKLGIFLFGNGGFLVLVWNELAGSAVMVSSWQMLRGGRSPTVVVKLISRRCLKYIYIVVQLESCYCVVEDLFRTCGNTVARVLERYWMILLSLLITTVFLSLCKYSLTYRNHLWIIFLCRHNIRTTKLFFLKRPTHARTHTHTPSLSTYSMK